VAGCERAAVHHALQLLLARLGDEVVALDHLESITLKELDIRVDDEDVIGVLHHGAGEPDRVPGVLGCGNRTRKSGSRHHRRVELSVSRRGERGAKAGIEQRIVLKHLHARAHGVQGIAACSEHPPSGAIGGEQPLLVRRAAREGQLLDPSPGPAVQSQARSLCRRRRFEDLHSDRLSVVRSGTTPVVTVIRNYVDHSTHICTTCYRPMAVDGGSTSALHGPVQAHDSAVTCGMSARQAPCRLCR
jgi:hypothetical protein